MNTISVLNQVIRQIIPNPPKLEELKGNKRLTFKIALENQKVIDEAFGLTSYINIKSLKDSIRQMNSKLDSENLNSEEKENLKKMILAIVGKGKNLDKTLKMKFYQFFLMKRADEKRPTICQS
jgi:hypothetical protein